MAIVIEIDIDIDIDRFYNLKRDVSLPLLLVERTTLAV